MAEELISQIATRATRCIEQKRQKLQKQMDKLESAQEDWVKVRNDPLGHSLTKVKKNDWLGSLHADVESVRAHQHLYPPQSLTVPLSFFNVGNSVRLNVHGVNEWNHQFLVKRLEDVYTVSSVAQDHVYLRLVEGGEQVVERQRVEEDVELIKYLHYKDLRLNYNLNHELLSVSAVTFDSLGEQVSSENVAHLFSGLSTMFVQCDLLES
jgi:hypothetical protein